MKTELQIAKKNIEEERKFRIIGLTLLCREHKQSCQRFLDFLDKCVFIYDGLLGKQSGLIISMKNKISDLKNTIKLYEDNGIK